MTLGKHLVVKLKTFTYSRLGVFREGHIQAVEHAIKRAAVIGYAAQDRRAVLTSRQMPILAHLILGWFVYLSGEIVGKERFLCEW